MFFGVFFFSLVRMLSCFVELSREANLSVCFAFVSAIVQIFPIHKYVRDSRSMSAGFLCRLAYYGIAIYVNLIDHNVRSDISSSPWTITIPHCLCIGPILYSIYQPCNGKCMTPHQNSGGKKHHAFYRDELTITNVKTIYLINDRH